MISGDKEGDRLTFSATKESLLAFSDVQQALLVELIAGLAGQRHQLLLVVSHLYGEEVVDGSITLVAEKVFSSYAQVNVNSPD